MLDVMAQDVYKRQVGSFWGNANTWASSAAAAGYTVNRTPEAGAVLVDLFLIHI